MESFDHNRYFENRNTLRVTIELTTQIKKVYFYLIDLEILANGTKDEMKYQDISYEFKLSMQM